MGKELKNKPLIEALIEIKWELEERNERGVGVRIDPNSNLLPGRMFDRVSNKYPFHEQLPSVNLPEEVAGYVVQHRFRVAKDDWPLIQVGPGIFTINETSKYVWKNFKESAIEAVSKLYDAYPNSENMKINSILLRYIDAFEVDYTKENIFSFLKDKMKIELSLPANLFEGEDIEKKPTNLNWQSVFRSSDPKGAVILRFATGEKENMPSLIWETMVHTTEEDVPQMPKGFEDWLNSAYKITDDWFFKIIEGELERRFSGE